MKLIITLLAVLSLAACSNGIVVRDTSERTDVTGSQGCIVTISEEAKGSFFYQSDSCVVRYEEEIK